MVRRHVISFKHAFDGLLYAISTQPNFIVHGVISSIAISLGILTGLSKTEWAMLVIVIGTGLVIELINTSIEAVVDLATQQWKHPAKIAKDTAAAAMLVYAVAATIFALFIFL